MIGWIDIERVCGDGRGEGVESADEGVGGMRLILCSAEPDSSGVERSCFAEGVLLPSGRGLGLRLELGLEPGRELASASALGTIVLAEDGCSSSDMRGDSGEVIGDEDGGDLIALADEDEKLRLCENECLRSGEPASLPTGVPR